MKPPALTFVAALALAAAAAAQTEVDQRKPAPPDGAVHVENLSGSVKVTGWDRSEVQVKGTLGDGAELAFDVADKRTRIEVEAQRGNPMAIRSELEVFVPSGSSVSVEGFTATIVVAGVSGSVKAETVNGSITQSGPAREVELQSVNGPVETTRAAGRVQAEAVNGSVTVRDASGELQAATVNGKLLVTGGSFDRAKLESVAGGVRFESGLSAKASLSVETVSGTVDLLLPAAFGAEFTVSTFSGSIANELGPAAKKAGSWAPGSELAFTSGSGGARVSVETLSGAVNIRKKP